MTDALFTVLTVADARDEQSVEQQCIDATSAGIPWYDEA